MNLDTEVDFTRDEAGAIDVGFSASVLETLRPWIDRIHHEHGLQAELNHLLGAVAAAIDEGTLASTGEIDNEEVYRAVVQHLPGALGLKINFNVMTG
jgi:hypothetical protein